MDVGAVVVAVLEGRVAGVDADAYPDGRTCRPLVPVMRPLEGDRRADGVLGTVEGDRELVGASSLCMGHDRTGAL